jgi:acetyltransferase-like isoleucine patch superfamily enzyme
MEFVRSLTEVWHEGVMSMRELSSLRLFLAALCEPVVRCAAWFSGLIGKDREGLELVLRGALIMPRSQRLKVGRLVRFCGPPRRIRIGTDVSFYGAAYLNANGPDGFLEIGNHTHIDQQCVLYAQGGLMIGADCAIAAGSILYTQTNADLSGTGIPVANQPTVYAPIVIKDGCWLGAGVRILPGITLNEGTHVGAGSVVTKSTEPMSVIAGVPAKVLRKRIT